MPLSPTAKAPVTDRSEATGVQVQNLSKEYPSFLSSGKTVAVNNVTLSVPPGDLYFLLGPSGCGKTTLLRMIAGFIEPTSGQVLFTKKDQVRDVTYMAAERRNAGMVFQSYALWPHMTVAENVGFGLDVRKVKGIDRKRRIAEALEAVHMGAYGERKPNQLSGGQQQRIALARALVIQPDVLLLDEPLSNLDARLRHELRSEIRRICKSTGITALYVTHDQKEALSIADGIAVLKDGQIIETGAPQHLYRHPESRFVASFLGESNFLRGTFLAERSGLASVRTGVGELAAKFPSGVTYQQGQPVEVCFRPESVDLAAGTVENTIAVEVVESIFLGEVCEETLRCADGSLVKRTTLGHKGRATAGDRLSVYINPQDMTLLVRD
ncbi:MAG: ABC transporter ATP-binding protein [Phycisphaeraceae bacterium]|nr:ABC transporter ATP-binding protein [Phycisphaeraceae bacterium]